MKEAFKLSDAELDIMLVLWECENPIRPSALLEIMNETRSWSISTLQTLLARLYEKKVVSFNVEKRFRYFYPIVTKEEFALEETKHLISKVGASSPVSLMAGLLGNANLTAEEIAQLEALLAKTKQN